jgi:predicted AAA+ superfamily ATPase
LHENDRYITEKRAQIKAMLERYIREGGFPEAQRLELKENYLRGLFDKIITKDIIMRYNIKYSRALKEMSIYLLSNFASRATYHKVKNIFDVKSVHTVKNYTHYFEEAYLIFELNAFSFKQKDLIKQPRKIYGIDTGLINAIAPKTSINAGRLMENAVFLQLKRLGREIYYYSDGNLEVDFLIKDGLKIDQLIQVCYSLDNIETKDRELRSLAKASKELGCENAVVLTWDTSGEETVKDVKIRMVPLWQWLCWG